METIKVLSITEGNCYNVFDKDMVFFWGNIEMCNDSHERYKVLFNCNNNGTEVSARVYDACVSFRFICHKLSVYDINETETIDVEANQIDSSLQHTNNVTLVERRPKAE